MSPLVARRRATHQGRAFASWPGLSARRAAAAGGPPPLPASPPFPSPPPASPAPAGPAHQKITLYAGAALVVLTVLVIVVLTSGVRRRALSYVPKRQSVVQVVDMRRFLAGPVYRTLAAADHPITRRLEAVEDTCNVSLRRDIAVVVDTDDSMILIGRFRPSRVRNTFKASIAEDERRINRGRQTPVTLVIRDDEVEGHSYSYCKQEGVDRGLAVIGSSVVCLGDSLSVRRFLKVRAGMREAVLDDEAFAAVYSPALARRALLYRFEKPGGKLLATTLRDILGETVDDLSAAFFTVADGEQGVELTIRFAARNAGAAQKLKAQLFSPRALAGLQALLGIDDLPRVTRSEATVTLESSLSLSTFEDIVARDKKGQAEARNLVLALIAS